MQVLCSCLYVHLEYKTFVLLVQVSHIQRRLSATTAAFFKIIFIPQTVCGRNCIYLQKEFRAAVWYHWSFILPSSLNSLNNVSLLYLVWHPVMFCMYVCMHVLCCHIKARYETIQVEFWYFCLCKYCTILCIDDFTFYTVFGMGYVVMQVG